MGSLTSKIADLEEEKKEASILARLRKLKEEITVDEDTEWMWKNKDKIIRNKKLIDLLG